MLDSRLIDHIHSSELTLSERVLACCSVARQHLESGEFDAGCEAIQHWWKFGEPPIIRDMSGEAAAELMFTAGVLTTCIAGTRDATGALQDAQCLLSAAMALFDYVGDKTKAIEARSELGYCYCRQGLIQLSRRILNACLDDLADNEFEVKSAVLVRLGSLERRAGRLRDSLDLLQKAGELIRSCSRWAQARHMGEYATTLKDLGISENRPDYMEQALNCYREALQSFELLGNRRYQAIAENNQGYLLLTLKRFEDAVVHLVRARMLFNDFGDDLRRAQVDETLAQLYRASHKFDLAQQSIAQAVETLETCGEETLLAEALLTQGSILCELGRRYEAKPILERAQRIASRCGDYEGAGRALLIILEEMCEQLGDDERRELATQATQLLSNSQQAATRERLRVCLERVAKAHAEFEDQREKAVHAEKMAALGELSFGVAHNVNNMLTGILGRAQLLLRANDPEKTATGLGHIIKAAEDGAHIIRRIQDFARQRPSREFEPIPIPTLLKDVYEMTRPRWEQRPDGRLIIFSLQDNCCGLISGDPVELREVLVNMVYNACDALPDGGAIWLSAEQTSNRVLLSIKDSGTGMPPEVKAKLFNPFFTTKGKAGTGMGLAVSFGIVRRHNGSIEVESEPGSGTTFTISLPLAEQTSPLNDRPHSAVRSERQTARVLIADDELHVREILGEAFRAEGCEVCTADSGEQALVIFDEHGGAFDAVITDIGMPDMNGWDLATEIRRRSIHIPLAIVSAWADSFARDTKESVKAEWVISKPFSINRISEVAREIIERKKLESFPKTD